VFEGTLQLVVIATLGGELTNDACKLVRDCAGDCFSLVIFVAELCKLESKREFAIVEPLRFEVDLWVLGAGWGMSLLVEDESGGGYAESLSASSTSFLFFFFFVSQAMSRCRCRCRLISLSSVRSVDDDDES
jgi:hypothetical protein